MAVNIGNDWDTLFTDEFSKPYYRKLRQNLIAEYKSGQVYPGMYDIFNALKYTGYSDVKCVILGQDPYHGPGQAHGLSFSVKEGVAPPPSLVNIFKELKNDLDIDIPACGDLTKWAREGVLLLNSILTVRAHEPASHRSLGWEEFTDRIIALLNEREDPIAFVLWGAFAMNEGKLITNTRHLLITSPHPSPLSASRGFFGSRPFSRVNAFLAANGQEPINWAL